MSIGELFRIKRRLWRDQMHVLRHFYKNPKFALIDLAFGCIGFFSNPYRVCRKFLQKKGEACIYAYGETPLSTLEKIAQECQISSRDRWLELGSGRGKGCFWMAHFIGCEVTGVEWIPQFTRIGHVLKFLSQTPNISFQCRSMHEADFRSITALYLYGTCLEDAEIQRLVQKMDQLPLHAKVITISEPLRSPSLLLEKSFFVDFPWGQTNAFLHSKKL